MKHEPESIRRFFFIANTFKSIRTNFNWDTTYPTRDDSNEMLFSLGLWLSRSGTSNFHHGKMRLVGCFIIFIYTRQLTFTRASFCKYCPSLCTPTNFCEQKWVAIESAVAGRIVDGRCKSARGSQWIVRQLSNWAAKRTRARDVCGIN